MKLHVFPPSPNAKKVMMAALEAGVSHETVIVDLTAGDQKKPDFLALNPNGKMPVLEYDDGESLWESNAITNRLASMTDSALWPKTNARYEILQWQFWEMAHWAPATSAFIAAHFFDAPIDREKATETVQIFARVLDGHLADRDWLVGDDMTTADISVASTLCYREVCGISLGTVPNIDRWMERISGRESWKAVTQDVVPEPA
ncbi:MAG: glutathione S-transferase family protein [Pseudomonadota bacterium]